MSTPHPADRGTAVRRFWRRYIALLAEAGIPEASRPWCRRHVETYIAAHPGRRLASHDAGTLTAYLESLDRHAYPDWRFAQAVEALRVLFVGLLAAPWATSFDWPAWRDFPAPLESGHPTLLRAVYPASQDVAPGDVPSGASRRRADEGEGCRPGVSPACRRSG